MLYFTLVYKYAWCLYNTKFRYFIMFLLDLIDQLLVQSLPRHTSISSINVFTGEIWCQVSFFLRASYQTGHMSRDPLGLPRKSSVKVLFMNHEFIELLLTYFWLNPWRGYGCLITATTFPSGASPVPSILLSIWLLIFFVLFDILFQSMNLHLKNLQPN